MTDTDLRGDMPTATTQEERAAQAFEQRFGTFGGVETRIVPIQVRSADNGDPNSEFSIDGHASVFNQASLDLGGFTEYIAPDAFDNALSRNGDVVANWDHDNRYVLGRTANKTLRLAVDQQGLAYWVRVAPTSYAADLRVLMERGDINQASFAFTVARDAWEITTDAAGNELVTRTILEVAELFDVCVTAQGAYPQTDSQVSRSYFRAEAEARVAAADQLRCTCGAFITGDATECGSCGRSLKDTEEKTADVEEIDESTTPDEADTRSLAVVKAQVRARNYKLQR